MALRNAFDELTTAGISRRLNMLVGMLAQFSLVLQRTNASIRTVIIGAVGSVTTVDTVTAVTTVATMTNQSQIGGVSAATMVFDSMATRWATTVRGRIQ